MADSVSPKSNTCWESETVAERGVKVSVVELEVGVLVVFCFAPPLMLKLTSGFQADFALDTSSWACSTPSLLLFN